MRVTILLFCAAALYCASAPKPLFDGKTLTGWNQCNGKAQYSVADGTLSGTTVEGSPNSFLSTAVSNSAVTSTRKRQTPW